MKKSPRTYVLRNRRELRAIESGVRQEIVDVLSQMGTVSVSEIAATLGRPADALYYHLRALQRAGLVVAAGERRRGRRRESLFRTIAPELMLRYEPDNKESCAGVNAIVASMLRLGARDFRRALGGGGVAVSGPRRELWALRATGWLSPGHVAEVNRSIKRLRASVTGPKGKGRLYGITVLLTPLDHRARISRQQRRREKK